MPGFESEHDDANKPADGSKISSMATLAECANAMQ
jgi:hypothetical protein